MDSVTRPDEDATSGGALIVRNPNRDHWTVIDNQSLRDEALSWQATGMLAYLVSLPDDWRVNIEDLCNRKRDGRTATRSALNELAAAGYIEKIGRAHV